MKDQPKKMRPSIWFLLVLAGQYLWAMVASTGLALQGSKNELNGDLGFFDEIGLLYILVLLLPGATFSTGWGFLLMKQSGFPLTKRSCFCSGIYLGGALFLLVLGIDHFVRQPFLSGYGSIFFWGGLFGGFICGLLLLGINRLFNKVPAQP